MEKKWHARLKSFLRLVDIFGDLALQSLPLPTDFWTPGTAREAFKGGTLGDVQSGGWPQKPNDPTADLRILERCHGATPFNLLSESGRCCSFQTRQ